jgi:predicted secreted protein
MTQESGIVIIGGAIILLVILGGGCLGTDQQHPKAGVASVKCSESLISGQNMTINETQNNATICAKLNSSLTIRLIDHSRTGWEWFVTASPGLEISDEGVTWYDQVGIPPTSLIEYGIHEWNVTMNDTGVQTIKAILRFPGIDRQRDESTFNLTIVVE